MDFKHTTLENGLTIVGEINPWAQSAAIGFFVKTGSRDETLEINGVSHFLEHMMFKGTEGLSALEVNEAFDKAGAKYNAFTSEENTVYYAAVLPEMLDEITDLWCRLMRPSLRDDDFTMEKNVIKQEIAMYKDYPHYDVIDQCRTLHFKDHPCGHSVLGTDESIDGMTSQQMRGYFEKRYAPNNMVVACCGDIDFDAVCVKISQNCGSWKPFETGRSLSFYPGSHRHSRQVRGALKQEHICLMSAAMGYQEDERFAASLLSVILGDSTGSRYFWGLVDTAIAETAVMHFEAMDGVGVMYSYFRSSPENAPNVMEVTRRIFEEIERDGITPDELEKARNKVLSTVTLKCETPMGRLVNLGFNWTYLGCYRSVPEDVQAIRRVTVDDVNALLKKYPPSVFSSYAMGPDKTDEPDTDEF